MTFLGLEPSMADSMSFHYRLCMQQCPRLRTQLAQQQLREHQHGEWDRTRRPQHPSRGQCPAFCLFPAGPRQVQRADLLEVTASYSCPSDLTVQVVVRETEERGSLQSTGVDFIVCHSSLDLLYIGTQEFPMQESWSKNISAPPLSSWALQNTLDPSST